MKKLHDRRSPAGLERVILKKMPMVFLGAFLVPLLMSGMARLLPVGDTAVEIAKYQAGVDIFSISICITVLTAVLTISIGCFVVVMMKGPAYVADAYELNDADRPAPLESKKKRRP